MVDFGKIFLKQVKMKAMYDFLNRFMDLFCPAQVDQIAKHACNFWIDLCCLLRLRQMISISFPLAIEWAASCAVNAKQTQLTLPF